MTSCSAPPPLVRPSTVVAPAWAVAAKPPELSAAACADDPAKPAALAAWVVARTTQVQALLAWLVQVAHKMLLKAESSLVAEVTSATASGDAPETASGDVAASAAWELECKSQGRYQPELHAEQPKPLAQVAAA